jgi:molecular chaperone DnaK (HSP70)
LLERTVSLARDAVAEAKRLGVARIDRILLVGGSSYMPQVQERLEAEFPGIPRQLFEPEQAVAKGAALYASSKQIQDAYQQAQRELFGKKEVDIALLPEDRRARLDELVRGRLPGKSKQAIAAGLNLEIINVASKSFGLVVLDDHDREVVAYLIKRNSAVPAEQEDTFGTYAANLSSVLITIVESEEKDLHDLPSNPNDPRCQRIKEVTFNLPPGLPRGHPIVVKYSLSEDGGRLQVHARDNQSGQAIDESIATFNAITPQELAEKQKDTQSINVQ